MVKILITYIITFRFFGSQPDEMLGNQKKMWSFNLHKLKYYSYLVNYYSKLIFFCKTE